MSREFVDDLLSVIENPCGHQNPACVDCVRDALEDAFGELDRLRRENADSRCPKCGGALQLTTVRKRWGHDPILYCRKCWWRSDRDRSS
jgi:hypothetical protein